MSFQSFNQAFAVTPSDDTPLPKGQCKALYVAGPAGSTLTVKCKEPNFNYSNAYGAHIGATAGLVTFENIQAGAIIPITATHVMNTDTTSTNIVSLH